MVKGLIGKKVGMSHVFNSEGDMIPVTVIEVQESVISQVKTKKEDGYDAVQVATFNVKESKLSKAEKIHFEKKGITTPKKYIKEFKFIESAPEVGKVIQITDVFKELDVVKVTGTSKGKGFQGVIKKHGFHGGPMAHGSRNHRHPGSIGACATPSRVFKGTKLPGRTGGVKSTVRNLKIVKINENFLFVSGSVPGSYKSLVTIERQK